MKHCTSAEAAKLLRKLNEDRKALLSKEEMSCMFMAAMGEDPESVRPIYDYQKTQDLLQKIDEQIRVVKHAINEFNLHTIIPEFNMNIDQMLVYIPQLTEIKSKLGRMKNRLPKQRENASRFGQSAVIDYSYANYDIQAVEDDYKKVSDTLAAAQTALDVINNTQTLDIPI